VPGIGPKTEPADLGRALTSSSGNFSPHRRAVQYGPRAFPVSALVDVQQGGHAHVEHCIEQMAGQEAHRTQTLAFLRELRAVHTVADGPQGFANSVPLLAEATNPDYALVRLHGRNVDAYNVKGASSAAERFDYNYPGQELREIMVEVIRLAYKVRNTHLIFNTATKTKASATGSPF
jgi:hypothetical protein